MTEKKKRNKKSKHGCPGKGYRALLYYVQGRRCYLCDKPMTDPSLNKTVGSTNATSYDHIVPGIRGVNPRENVALCHAACNLKKGDRPPTEEELVRGRVYFEMASQFKIKRLDTDLFKFVHRTDPAASVIYERPKGKYDKKGQ